MTALSPTGSIRTSPGGRSAPRRRGWRIAGRVAFGVVAGVIVLATAAAFFLVWTVQRSFPQTSGELELAGLEAEVTVQRDGLGVPTITAGSTHDLFFAQGFVHAQDRFWEMDFRRHVTSGRVAEIFGESQVATDAFLRTLDWHGIAEQEVEAMDETTRAYYEAYADGVNAYLADHAGATASLEYAVLGLTNAEYEIEPWSPADSVAWLKAMAWDLRGNVEDEVERALLASTVDPATIAKVYPAYPFDRNPVIVPSITSPDELTDAASAPSGADAQADAAAEGEGEDEASGSNTASPSGGDDLVVTWTEADGVLGAVSALIGDLGEGIGSNSWVVSGDLTESGLPLLANDPHLGASLPSVWYQMQLRCAPVTDECPFAVGGFSFSGLPSIVIGHNTDMAWGFTNLTTDVTDLYIEKVDGDQYWRDGALVPLETRIETLTVAGGDDIELEVRSTVHGPIVSGLTEDFTALADAPMLGTGHVDGGGTWIAAPDAAAEALPGEYAVSLRWTALDPGTTSTAIFAMNTAADFTDFQAAAELFDVPAQNLVYADTEGNIGYQTPGRLPIRGAGNGWVPQPGWSSAYDWPGYIPFGDLPVAYNPSSGYIVTANNAIVTDDYEYFLSRDWDYGFRAARIAALIEDYAAEGPLTAQDMRDIQFDQEFWTGKKLAAVMQNVTVDDDTATAVDLLRTWDAQSTADSAAAAYANVLWSNLVNNVFTEREAALPTRSQSRLFTVVGAMLTDPEDPLWTNEALGIHGMDEMLARSAEDAYAEIVGLQGEDPAAWRWGSLHAITLTHQTFGTSGIAPIEWVFNRGPYDVGGGASVVDATGWVLGASYETTTVPSMRMVVDLADWDASSWNHLTGASGHAFHAHYTDQTDAWVKGEQTPWAFTADAVDTTTVDTLVLRPAG